MEEKKEKPMPIWLREMYIFLIYFREREKSKKRKVNATLCTLKVQNSFLTNNSGT
jgi:hypothetical protein